MKTQKTVYDDLQGLNGYEPKVGDEVILISYSYEGSDSAYYTIIPHHGVGVGGNANPNLRCYHGWRGCTDGRHKFAHGVRKVIKVTEIRDYTKPYDYKITVGPDLHPDWE